MSAPVAPRDDGAHAILRRAAAWYADLQAGDDDTEADAALRRRWRLWLEAAPAHRAPWERIEAVNRQFDQLPAAPAHAAL